MDQKQFDAVVFDMDGLMFDTERLYYRVGGEVLARRGKEMTPELSGAMMGLRSGEALELMRRWHGLSDSVEKLAEETDALLLGLLRSELRPMPGLMALLAALDERSLPRAVATSSSRLHAQTALAQLELTDRFAFVLAAEDVVHGKPHPEIYLLAAERVGVDPESILVLEDSQAGVQAAKAAGAVCLVVPHEHNGGQDFSLADAVVPSLNAPEVFEMVMAD